MLIQPDKSKLGDGQLKDSEAVAKLKEDNARAAAQNRIPDQDILEDKAAALGLPMQPSELINRLRKMNPKIIVEKGGLPNAVAVRYPRIEDGVEVKSYVTGFYVDQPLPEFSCVVVDERGLPWREIRGWRSVLLALVSQRIISKKQVRHLFGNANGQRAVLWNKQTQHADEN